MITNKCLRARVGGSDKVYHLHTTAPNYTIGSGNIMVRIGNADLYYPLFSTVTSNSIRVVRNGQARSAVNLVPKAIISYTYAYDSQPYKSPDLYKSMSITMQWSITINNVVELQNANGSTWTTVLSIAKGGTSATAGSNTRRPSTTWRLKVGSWTSSQFTLNSSSGSNTVTIPEAQWGV